MTAWKVKYINKNKYSRPQMKLLNVKGIIMHYTANNGGTANNHYSYFNNLKNRYASAHIFVDKKEALLIIPLDEVAYHSNDKPSKVSKFRATAPYYKHGNANLTTIGVELCLERDGSLHPDTLKRAERVVYELIKRYKLTTSDIYRHYDITGKNCPAFWVAKPKDFTAFKNRVKAMDKPKVSPKPSPKPNAPKKATGSTYTVRKGDTLWGIARANGITVAKLKSLNGLTSNVIHSGQRLQVSAKKVTKYVRVKASKLYTYNTANWNNKGTIVSKGEVFTVVKELTVKGSKMYQLKSGKYITANPSYVAFYTK